MVHLLRFTLAVELFADLADDLAFGRRKALIIGVHDEDVCSRQPSRLIWSGAARSPRYPFGVHLIPAYRPDRLGVSLSIAVEQISVMGLSNV